jgi:hypothetical protein
MLGLNRTFLNPIPLGLMYVDSHRAQSFIEYRHEIEDKNGEITQDKVQPEISTTVSSGNVTDEMWKEYIKNLKQLFLAGGVYTVSVKFGENHAVLFYF